MKSLDYPVTARRFVVAKCIWLVCWLGSLEVQSQNWDLSRDRLTSVNPSGQLAYGARATASGTNFALLNHSYYDAQANFIWDLASSAPRVLLNPNNVSAIYLLPESPSVTQPKIGVVRWTAPATRYYLVQAKFNTLGSRDMDVRVYLAVNGNLVLDQVIQGRGTVAGYTNIFLLSSNSVVDFEVGHDNVSPDWTGVNGVVTTLLPPIVSLVSPMNNFWFTAGDTVTLEASASDPDGSVTSVAFYAGTNQLGVATNKPYYVKWSNDAAGVYNLRAVATDNLGLAATSAMVQVTAVMPGQPASLVHAGAVWKYLDDGSKQPASWAGLGFNDSEWAFGQAQLGYGDGDEATLIRSHSAEGAPIITTYFRNTFHIGQPGFVTNLALRLLRDAGAVVYLNGVEILRSNMPMGEIDYRTLALTTVEGADESNFFPTPVLPNLLLAGTNVLAVEIHQAITNTSDLSFDLELVANSIFGNLPPVALCQDRIVAAEADCAANASIDAGSFDPEDGAKITLTQKPPGPYPLGVTEVTLTVTDTQGAVNKCTATVTVLDRIAPSLACPTDSVMEFTDSNGTIGNFNPAATDDCGQPINVVCVPASGTVLPIGHTEIRCTATDVSGNSAACEFGINVLGALGVKQNVLNEMTALGSAISNAVAAQKLEEAIWHLSLALESDFWLDQIHLRLSHGDRVFKETKETVQKLDELLKSKQTGIPASVLQTFIERLVRADRLLAVVEIQESARGAVPKKVEEDNKELAKADDDAAGARFETAIEHYRIAWKHALHLRLQIFQRVADGEITMRFIGNPGVSYIIQTSTNLLDWRSVGTCVADEDGTADFRGREPNPSQQRFYRIAAQ